MNDSITSLTDKQAIDAIRLFYDFTTPELWEGEKKPVPERVEKIAAALVESASAEDKPIVAALLEDGNDEYLGARADVCRIILSQLRQSAKFLPIVDRAIETASKAHAGIDPITGAFIIAFLLATTKVEETPDGRKIQFGAGTVDIINALKLPELLEKLPPVLKALPERIWNAFLGKL